VYRAGMAQLKNRKFVLASRPVGVVTRENLPLVEETLSPLGAGEVLIRNLYLSLDPTNRIWMSDMEQYMPPVQIGETMRGIGIGQVIESNDPDYAVGDIVQGFIGWQDYSVSRPGPFAMTRIPRELPVPLTAWVGPLYITGLTAYFGLLELGKPREGETVVISAAAGATGSVAGQIAKIKGCRAVGIAGSDEKCAWLTGELGFDAAVNYKQPDFRDRLRAACPNGVDIDYENVGGEILDSVMSLMNMKGRVVICGLISAYNATAPMTGPQHFQRVLMKRLRIEGFIVTDFLARFPEAAMQIARWLLEGKIKTRETVVEGLESALDALNKLFTGENTGKLYIKLADAA
jgi:NADPH-dependent curcumin reductase CurA